MAVQKQDDQHEHTYVRIRDVVLKTCLGRWTIGRDGEGGSGISVLPARHDDDDDDDFWKGPKLIEDMRERQRRGDEGRGNRLAEDCHRDLFLNERCDSIFKVFFPYFINERRFTGILPGEHFVSAPICHSSAVTGRLGVTDRDTCVCINSWRLSVLAACDSRNLLQLMNARELFSRLHSWNILSEKSLYWHFYQRPLCNSSRFRGRYCFPCFAPLYPWYVIYNVEC